MMIKSNKSIACIAKKECLKQKRMFAFETSIRCTVGPKIFIKVVLGVMAEGNSQFTFTLQVVSSIIYLKEFK